MDQSLLSKQQLAERWGISASTLDRRIREGIIKPVKGYGHPKFNLEDILKAEGTDYSKMSPFERRKLEQEKAELEQKVMRLEEENQRIKRQMTNVVAEIMPILKL